MARNLSHLAGVVVGASAFCFFWAQPLSARTLLPILGGNQAAWNASMVFFQAALLSGYAIAHAMGKVRHPGPWILVLAAAACLQLTAGPPRIAPGGAHPAWTLLVALSGSLALPAMVLASVSPLLQKWRSRDGSSPWSLYAWSNLGSLLALVAFPLVFERALALSEQYRIWAVLGACTLVGLVVLGLREPRGADPASVDADAERPEAVPGAIAWGWLARSALASSLLLSVTAHLATDVASVPLLWILPLVLFLGSFAWSFRPGCEHARPDAARGRARLFLLPLVIWMGAQPRIATAPWLPLLGHLVVFGFVVRGLAAQLVASRPAPSALTTFYMVIAAGGLLGSLVNTFLAPILFREILEYRIGLVVAAFLLGSRPDRSTWTARALDLILPAALAAAILWLSDGLVLESPSARATRGLVVVGLPGAVALFFLGRSGRYALALAAILFAAAVQQDTDRGVVFKERGDYGAFRVQSEFGDAYRVLVHGSTIHGRQATDSPHRFMPLAYYHATGPAGDAWSTFARRDTSNPVAVIGLGIGSMAAYAEPGRHLDFYELDPAIVRLATDTRWFTHLADCRGTYRVIEGDARVSLEGRPRPGRSPVGEDASGRGYGLIVLDAFSSDAIPVHLLTREALGVYLEHLAPRGILAFHISNRYLSLAGVVRDLAASSRLIAARRADPAGPEDFPEKVSSEWIVMARAPADLEPLLGDPRWQVLVASDPRPWTDDRADIWSVFRW